MHEPYVKNSKFRGFDLDFVSVSVKTCLEEAFEFVAIFDINSICGNFP